MRLLVLILIFVSNTVHADLYKCVKDGKHSYQDHPCDGARSSANTARASVSTVETMAGCYEADFPGWETGRNIESFEVRSTGNGRFVMRGLGSQRIGSSGNSKTVSTFDKNQRGMPMKRATPEELQRISNAFGPVTEGISLASGHDDDPTYKPIGFYRGKDEKGDGVILAYFFFSTGLAKNIPCPPGL